MKHAFFILFVALSCLGASPLRAEFKMPVAVPLEQMEEYLQSLLKNNPKDADLLYRLGRIHYLAFEMGVGVTYTFTPDEPGNGLPGQPYVHDLMDQNRFKAEEAGEGNKIDVSGGWVNRADWKVEVMSPAQRVSHAKEAKAYFQKSLALNPKQGLTWLSYGWFTRTWSDLEALHTVKGAGDLKDLTTQEALKAFVKAWQCERKTDLKRRHLPLDGTGGMVSHEAASSWLALAKESRVSDRSITREMERHLKRLSNLEIGFITPILFHPEKSMKDEVPVDRKASVSFDMAGDGSGGRWTWPQQGAVLLVWNPSGTVRNLNGSQLFGGYTWEMFWDHGFDALAILDVDRDGVLRGGELAAISGWKDLPPYGICEGEELITLEKLGVVALHLKSQPYGGDDALVWHPQGVEMKDGRRLPLWDWLAQPAASAR